MPAHQEMSAHVETWTELAEKPAIIDTDGNAHELSLPPQ